MRASNRIYQFVTVAVLAANRHDWNAWYRHADREKRIHAFYVHAPSRVADVRVLEIIRTKNAHHHPKAAAIAEAAEERLLAVQAEELEASSPETSSGDTPASPEPPSTNPTPESASGEPTPTA